MTNKRDEPKDGHTDLEPGASDPQTESRRREHEMFERSMAEHDLLEEDGSVKLEQDKVRHEEPPGTEQSAG